jgi:hypothetical protein
LRRLKETAMIEFMHAMSVGTYAPMLRSLSGVLARSREHARTTGADLEALASAKLAPDMFNLALQVDVGCYQASHGAATLAGGTPPGFEPGEASFSAFQRRIETTVAYVESLPQSAFAGAADRALYIPLPDAGITLEMTGLEFLRDWSLPHFYFHMVTAYDILRANGAPLGKLDYLAHAGYAIRRDA